MNILTTILVFILIGGIVLGVNLLCKKYIFSKIHVNKWIPLGIAVALFAFQLYLNSLKSFYVSSAVAILSVVFFLWFMDITQRSGYKKKEKQIKIKPKAKPNRVKKNKK